MCENDNGRLGDIVGMKVLPYGTRHKKVVSRGVDSRKRLIISLAITGAIILALVLVSPVSGLTIVITDPSPTTLGGNISFQVIITVEDGELLPIENVNLEIYNASDNTYYLICTNLPLISITKIYSTAGGNVTVQAVPGAGWGYGYGYGYVEWENYGYYFGYGYGYGYGPGSASITYNVTWASPSAWPAGNYVIKATVIANGQNFEGTRTVGLSVVAPPTTTTPPTTTPPTTTPPTTTPSTTTPPTTTTPTTTTAPPAAVPAEFVILGVAAVILVIIVILGLLKLPPFRKK